MMANYPIECLLRPPIEWYTSATCSLSAALLWASPELLLIPKQVALVGSMGLILYGLKRFYEGYGCLRYRRHLKRYPNYAAASKDIPCHPQLHFIGRGFHWQERHTQRLFEVRDTDNKTEYRRPLVVSCH